MAEPVCPFVSDSAPIQECFPTCALCVSREVDGPVCAIAAAAKALAGIARIIGCGPDAEA